jgi:hypothetical protein
VRLDEAALFSGTMAIISLYWIPPVPKETYLHWIATHLVLLLGAYVAAFEVPWLISVFISYRLASVLCLSVYCGFAWFLRKQQREV